VAFLERLDPGVEDRWGRMSGNGRHA
jgi:hypothetical protein